MDRGRAGATLALAIVLSGCGARTTLDPGPDPQADAGVADGGSSRDGGPVDAGFDAGSDAGPELPCRADRDCSRGVCRAAGGRPPSDLMPLPLVCGAPDVGAPVDASCLESSECDRGICAVAGTCVAPCATDTDCPEGDRCQLVYVRTGALAMQPVEACVAIVAAAPDVRAEDADAPLALPAFGEVLDPLPDLGPNALVVWTGPSGAFPFISSIRTRDATGTGVFDVFSRDPSTPAPAWGVSPTTITDLATLLYPNGPNTPASVGGFTVALGSLNGLEGPLTRSVLRREGEGSTLDLDVYLVGGARWTSTGGSVPPELAGALRQVRFLLGQVRVELGEVRVHEVVGGLRRRFELLDAVDAFGIPEGLADLYRLSAGARRPSVHVFFVRSIEGALGIASGIPGPLGLPGTGASGVAIATDAVPTRRLPEVLVHEIGHFVGLFHTAELDGTVNDPLPDTPECRLDRDRDGDGFLLPDECVGAGADNVMFWAGSGRELSPQQGELFRRAHFVR